MRWAFIRTLYDAGMHTRRPLAFVLAVLALAAGLIGGCSKSEAGGALPDPAALLAESSAATKGLTSAHLELKVTGDTLRTRLKLHELDGDLTTKPDAAKGHAKVLYIGILAEADFVVLDGTLYASIDPGRWLTMDAKKIYDIAAILNPERGLANVLANFTDAEAVRRETIGGVQTIKVTGDVSLEAVNAIAKEVGANKPVPGTAWIRDDDSHELVQVRLEPNGGSITMTLSEWNKPVDITKPADV